MIDIKELFKNEPGILKWLKRNDMVIGLKGDMVVIVSRNKGRVTLSKKVGFNG